MTENVNSRQDIKEIRSELEELSNSIKERESSLVGAFRTLLIDAKAFQKGQIDDLAPALVGFASAYFRRRLTIVVGSLIAALVAALQVVILIKQTDILSDQTGLFSKQNDLIAEQTETQTGLFRKQNQLIAQQAEAQQHLAEQQNLIAEQQNSFSQQQIVSSILARLDKNDLDRSRVAILELSEFGFSYADIFINLAAERNVIGSYAREALIRVSLEHGFRHVENILDSFVNAIVGNYQYPFTAPAIQDATINPQTVLSVEDLTRDLFLLNLYTEEFVKNYRQAQTDETIESGDSNTRHHRKTASSLLHIEKKFATVNTYLMRRFNRSGRLPVMGEGRNEDEDLLFAAIQAFGTRFEELTKLAATPGR